ncbi:MAG: glucose-6-phosphate isomerase, partial [Muribaculaceae bacterium]|nr:glucose-6-phosphate isomerase [Muribaculaceae bacterium]
MKTIKVNIKNVLGPISKADINSLDAASADAIEKLHKGSGLGNDFLGWLDLPSRTPAQEIDDIIATANNLRANCDVVVVIGIGGSYLGAKAVIEALSDTFASYRGITPQVLFAGQNIGEDYLYELMDYLKGKKFGIVVISKSGT